MAEPYSKYLGLLLPTSYRISELFIDNRAISRFLIVENQSKRTKNLKNTHLLHSKWLKTCQNKLSRRLFQLFALGITHNIHKINLIPWNVPKNTLKWTKNMKNTHLLGSNWLKTCRTVFLQTLISVICTLNNSKHQ